MATGTATRLTYDDYAELPADGRRYEIIDGELYVNPAPVPQHQQIVGNLYLALRQHVDQHAAGRVLVAPIDVVLGQHEVVQPDVIAIRTDRASIVGEKNVQGAPDLVVEVLSDSSRRIDEIEKRKLYERAGVAEYWIVDPVLESVKVYLRRGETFERTAELTLEAEHTLSCAAFPGLTIALSAIFAG